MELENAERKHQPLTLEQAQSVLSRAARNVGRIYSVGLSVGLQSNGLMFVDDLGANVIDDFAPEGRWRSRAPPRMRSGTGRSSSCLPPGACTPR